MKKTPTFAALFGLLLAGCADPLGPEPAVRHSVETAPTLEFSVRVLTPGEPLPLPSATGEAGRIDVHGALTTPVPCYDIVGTVSRHATDVTLEVHATRQPGSCIQVITDWAYEGEIADLEPGSYQVRIVHVHADAEERGETVLEQEVQVR